MQQHVSEELEGKYRGACQVKAQQEEQIKELQAEIESKDKQLARKDIILAERFSKGGEQDYLVEELTEANKQLHR